MLSSPSQGNLFLSYNLSATQTDRHPEKRRDVFPVKPINASVGENADVRK
jgi:hypothetical protein